MAKNPPINVATQLGYLLTDVDRIMAVVNMLRVSIDDYEEQPGTPHALACDVVADRLQDMRDSLESLSTIASKEEREAQEAIETQKRADYVKATQR